MTAFRICGPFYLVYRRPLFTVSAVRFRFEDEKHYRDWQVVSVVPGDDTWASDTESHEWLLLGFIFAGIRFDTQLRCCTTQGRVGIAECHRLIALEAL
jgi:hypothetical protein